MNIASAAIFLGLLAALGIALWGLCAEQRSAVVGVIAAAVALLAAGGAWYAWAESKSIPWTVGYGVVVVGSVASAIRQFVGGGSIRQ